MNGPTQANGLSTTATEEETFARHLPQPLDWSGVLAQQGYVVGIDIGGEGERVALADLHGGIIGRESHLAQGEKAQPAEVLDRIASMIRGLLDKDGIKMREVLRVGVGFGGPVDVRQGTVLLAPDNRSWEGFPVAGNLEAQLDVPAMLDNDSRLAALGEMWFGAGVGDPKHDLVYIHWSTGVGGGIVEDGHLLRGATTLAGEIGHMVVATGSDALPCRCGGKGHLEAYVRGPALLARARQLAANTPLEAELTDVYSLFVAAEREPAISRLVSQAVELMAVTVANLITALNPSIVVIGGSVGRAAQRLIPDVEKLARQLAMPVSAAQVEVVPALLGENSALMGAIALGLDSLKQ